MKMSRNISIVLLCISAVIGLVRGYRMMMYPTGNSLLFPYPLDMIGSTVFNNYAVLGAIVFFLVGIFSIAAIFCTFFRIRNYAYFIIVEGIFLTFFVLIHILLTGFSLVHVCILPICIATIILGIFQTPSEF